MIKAQEYFDDKKKQKVDSVRHQLTHQLTFIDEANTLLSRARTILETSQPQVVRQPTIRE